jgi:hypothetical protein
MASKSQASRSDVVGNPGPVITTHPCLKPSLHPSPTPPCRGRLPLSPPPKTQTSPALVRPGGHASPDSNAKCRGKPLQCHVRLHTSVRRNCSASCRSMHGYVVRGGLGWAGLGVFGVYSDLFRMVTCESRGESRVEAAVTVERVRT